MNKKVSKKVSLSTIFNLLETIIPNEVYEIFQDDLAENEKTDEQIEMLIENIKTDILDNLD